MYKAVVCLFAVACALPFAHAGFYMPGLSNCSQDVLLLVDSSQSITENTFHMLKLFLFNMALRYDISPNDTRFGLVAFNELIRYQFPLNAFDDMVQMQMGVVNMPYTTGVTNIGMALDYADFMLHSARDGVPASIILFSDGRSSVGRSPVAAAASLRAKYPMLAIYAVGVPGVNGFLAPVDVGALAAIAGDRGRVIKVQDVDTMLVDVQTPLVDLLNGNC